MKKQSSEALQMLPKQKMVWLPLLFHLSVEVSCVFLQQPNSHPINLTKNYSGGFLPLHLVQKSQNKSLFQNYSHKLIAILYHEHLALMSAQPSIERQAKGRA